MQNRAKHALRVALAEQAFLESQALVDHVISLKLHPGSHLYFGCVAGIVTSYCRPFKAASGLGPLPAEFENFSASPDHKLLLDIHTNLMIARDKVSAHHDAEFAEAKFEKVSLVFIPVKLNSFSKTTDSVSIRMFRTFHYTRCL